MRVTAAGFLTDHKSRVLLQQIDAATLMPIRCSLEPGVLPADTLARAFREQTGLYVMPVRLTGLYYDGRNDEVSFCFRCTMRGGDLAIPEGQPPAGFFDGQPLPRGLAAAYRWPADDALHHEGGPACLLSIEESWGARLGRRLSRRTRAAPPALEWAVTVAVVASVAVGFGGAVAWVRARPDEPWRLPAGRVAPGEAPWQTLRRLLSPLLRWYEGSEDLSGVYLAAGRPALTLVFAVALRGVPTPNENLHLAAEDDAAEVYDAQAQTQALNVRERLPSTPFYLMAAE